MQRVFTLRCIGRERFSIERSKCKETKKIQNKEEKTMKKVVILAAIVVMAWWQRRHLQLLHHYHLGCHGSDRPRHCSVAMPHLNVRRPVAPSVFVVALIYLSPVPNNSNRRVLTSGTAKDSITAAGSATLVGGDVTQNLGIREYFRQPLYNTD